MNRFISFSFALLSLVLLTSGCDLAKSDAPEEMKAYEAIVAHVVDVISRRVGEYSELTGRAAAVESVEVRAQVSGYLESINFKPGSFVHKGDVLFQLDSRVYQAVLDQRESDVAAKEAELKQLDSDLARQHTLDSRQATSKQQVEQAQTDYDTCLAQLEAARANLERAKIDLDYATIRAPIDGEVSREQITVGNLVSTGSTLLTNVVAVDPIHVFFDVDERSLLRFREETKELAADEQLRVKFAIGDGAFDREAVVDFSEPRLNETTGTLEFRAVADNKPNENGRRDLLPGLRLRVLFPTTPEYEAVLVPEEAIVTDQNVKRVYALGENNTAEFTPVELGPLQDDNMRVIKAWLKPGDKVIVDNLLRIRPDSIIEPIPAPSQSTTRIVREDGTIINRDGTVEHDDLYEWSLQRDKEKNAESNDET
ncbi:MAG: efflux RND transporter periplasmic adaptor subunit [Thermoguttaceae bacterium]|nr:efflux RND transporter periplasmic adaptor subunit [Thermoguttaceae bacterium]